jgi:hypothetical protein
MLEVEEALNSPFHQLAHFCKSVTIQSYQNQRSAPPVSKLLAAPKNNHLYPLTPLCLPRTNGQRPTGDNSQLSIVNYQLHSSLLQRIQYQPYDKHNHIGANGIYDVPDQLH